MKKLLIISGLAARGKSIPYAEYFLKNVENYEFTDLHFDRLVIKLSPSEFTVTDGRTGRSIGEYDLVMIREYKGQLTDIAYVVCKFLLTAKVPFFNQNYLAQSPASKIAQQVVFREEGLLFPRTVFSLDPSLIKQDLEDLGYPFILKDTHGTRGEGNLLIHSFDELVDAYDQNEGKKFIAQEFLANTHDYRVLIMGGRPPIQIKRTAAGGSHLNNTSQGGTGVIVEELPQDILTAAASISRKFRLSVGGVDIMPNSDDGKFYFLEVNTQPQLVTGVQVDKKIKAFKEFLDDYLGDTGTGS